MLGHRLFTSAPAPGRTGKTRVWPLTIALLAGLAPLQVLEPGVAQAQTSADSTVTVLWTAPGDDGNVGRATSYDVRYRTVNVSGTDTLSWWNAATQATGEPTPSIAGQTDSLRVTRLIPGSTYYFMVRSSDEVPNVSGFSNIAVKTLQLDTTAPAAIANLSITGATGNSLSLRWNAPGDDGSTGTASSYDVRYSTSPITTSNWSSATQATGEPAPAVAGTVQNFTLGGLQGSQTYYVAIRATDDRGNVSALSNVVNGTTTDTIPPAPVDDLSYDSGALGSRDQVVLSEVAGRNEGHAL